ncbi:MAG: arsenite methyltransferase [Bacteroidetes bacterium]|nr:arsenite methyltransferase [Bacteroidota bacterium]MBU1680984.1 arsenite methyltransferase [Bacteroidota bacterium]
MRNEKEIKEIVKEKYGEIAKQTSSCCGPTSCCGTSKIIDYTIMQDDYANIDGYVKDADLGLGCGLPTEFANINLGDTVVDLGSGAGNDVFVARALVGNEGKIIGIDMTQEMIDRANMNKNKIGYTNVEFYLGEIENIPLENSTADVVVSNCVLNLVPDKSKAFKEIYRILNYDGRFCVSDIVIKGELPEGLKKSVEMYAGCVAGAVQQEEYLQIIEETGFKNIEIKKTKTIEIPEKILCNYLSAREIEIMNQKDFGIFSITVTAEK